MRPEIRSVDYRKAKTAALQPLAAAGDEAARQELARRGDPVIAAFDLTVLDYRALRALVLAWRDGVTTADRADNFSRAQRAQLELEARHRADLALWTRGQGERPRDLPQPPWLAPRAPRCRPWRRPAGSTLYPAAAERPSDDAAVESWRRVYDAQRGRRAAESE
ncbi:MAG: hypothetical protein AB7Q29_11610 [Vicinamibacterales bacterium]